ncbi:hypothetical protein TNCV_2262771 [Trichonephila clavipes]|nr:hypothetical protein TNCV_2262771 [Trichonephila clavipes]
MENISRIGLSFCINEGIHCDNNVSSAPITENKDILEFVPKSVTNVDSDEEKEANHEAPLLKFLSSVQNKEHHEKFALLFRRAFNDEMNKKNG